jgi:hypothetical protein
MNKPFVIIDNAVILHKTVHSQHVSFYFIDKYVLLRRACACNLLLLPLDCGHVISYCKRESAHNRSFGRNAPKLVNGAPHILS